MPTHETLGSNILPSHYKIRFEPNMSTFRTRGLESVDLHVKNPTDQIVMNASELEIHAAYLEYNGQKLDAENIKLNEEDGTVHFSFPNKFEGDVRLNIEFVATNNDKMHGFYRSLYDENGSKKHILTSHFEPIDARTAFPCFDEPEFKATLDVILRVDENLKAISNMPKKREKYLDGILAGKKDVFFRRTPKMSTYLLYMGVGDFEQSHGKAGKVMINITTVPGKKDQTNLPKRYARRVLGFYEDYFGVKFPLPKIDLIAVPDFPMGAMENWGAITFRDGLLLCNNKSAEYERQGVAIVIAHELAHQWFGNLVTMKWWDDLWLNESFATFMEQKSIGKLFPNWKVGISEVPAMLESAFSADSLLSTHPVSVEVKKASEANELFDRISYEKGGSVLRMLEDFVGEDNFRKGLKKYISDHKYSNATKSDLWDALSKASGTRGEDIKRVIQTWVEKPGHPIVYVDKRENGRFVLRQKRFLKSGDVESKWPIPLHYKTDKGEGFLMLEDAEQVLDLDADWIKINYGQHGFYRSAYDQDLLGKLKIAIEHKQLSTMDSWGILEDMFTLTRSGRTPVKAYLSFISGLEKTMEHPAISSVMKGLGWLFKQHNMGGNAADIKTLRKDIASSLLEKLTWSKRDCDTEIELGLRRNAIFILGDAGDEHALANIRKLFNSYMVDEELDPDMRGTIYGAIARNGDRKTYEEFLNRYRSTQNQTEKLRFLGTLGLFRDPEIIKDALNFAHSEEVRPQDSFRVADAATASQLGTEVFLSWLKSNWKMLKDRYGSGSGLLKRYLETLSSAYTLEQREEVSTFFSNPENTREDLTRPLSSTLETIDLNIAYRRTNSLPV